MRRAHIVGVASFLLLSCEGEDSSSDAATTTAAIESPVAVDVTEDVEVRQPAGKKAQMAPLAAAVAAQGAVVFNATYGNETPAEFLNDNGCSLQLAIESAADFGGDPERVVVVGNSFGGTAGLIWGMDSPLRNEPFTDCPADAESVQSTIVELTEPHGSTTIESRPEFHRDVDLVAVAVGAVR